jgi:hypothetical protein
MMLLVRNWLIAVLLTAVFVLCLSRVHAHWKPQYASADQVTRDWYESRELTAAAQQRFRFKSCCNNSDVVQTQFHVNKNNGADEWFYLSDGKWTRIPDDVIHWDEHAPNGKPVMFAVGGNPVCFFPPDSGI